MNFGTKLRTILAIATSLNTALMATDLTGFHNPAVDMTYKIVSIVLNFVIVACVTYYNNDYTDGGAIGTKVCRTVKEQEDGDLTLRDEIEHVLGGEEDDD